MSDSFEGQRFEMFERNTRILHFDVEDGNGEDVPVDGATAAIFAMFDADDGVEKLRLTLGSGITVAGNVMTVTIPNDYDPALEVGEFLFELQLTDASSFVHTIAQGTATVKESYIL